MPRRRVRSEDCGPSPRIPAPKRGTPPSPALGSPLQNEVIRNKRRDLKRSPATVRAQEGGHPKAKLNTKQKAFLRMHDNGASSSGGAGGEAYPDAVSAAAAASAVRSPRSTLPRPLAHSRSVRRLVTPVPVDACRKSGTANALCRVATRTGGTESAPRGAWVSRPLRDRPRPTTPA